MEEFIQFLSKKMNDLYAYSSGTYKDALGDVADCVCEYLETRGHQINLTPVTEKYIASKKHHEIQIFNDLSLEEQIYKFFIERGEDIKLENIHFDDDMKRYFKNIYQTGIDSAFRNNGLTFDDEGKEIKCYDELLNKIKNNEDITICVLNGGCCGCPIGCD